MKIIAPPAFPKINDDGEHRPGVQHDQQHGHFGAATDSNAHDFFRGDDVGGTGNRQQFARALNQRQNQDLKIIQHERRSVHEAAQNGNELPVFLDDF